MSSVSNLDQLCVNTIRFLSVDAVQKANSGHPGLPMGAAPMAYVLWTKFLRHNPSDPGWPDRDRFVLSGGHGSMLLYSLLHLTGYDLSLDEIKNFRQWGSQTPGHPEHGLAPGIETTTGPLGQGFANGVGLALAEAQEAGADAVTIANTWNGVSIDIATRRSHVTRPSAGLSGPGIRPATLYHVWRCHRALPDLPIVGCGGITDTDSAVQYLLAGATALQIGTGLFLNPNCPLEIKEGLEDYLDSCGEASLAGIIGRFKDV